MAEQRQIEVGDEVVLPSLPTAKLRVEVAPADPDSGLFGLRWGTDPGALTWHRRDEFEPID